MMSQDSSLNREIFTTILQHNNVKIEQIISPRSHSTSQNQPWIQAHDEWVFIVQGGARIKIEQQEYLLKTHDHCLIPSNKNHWVTWTSPDIETIWLAVHLR